ncbi:MAG: hypothetical protein IT360_24215 [Gemmatimonadaceae bacterium]|nr:hypothetical protein [Gemmatimonadaceae bacterium]
MIDRATQTVRLTLPSGATRVARRYGSQGCVPLPTDRDSVFVTPVVVKPDHLWHYTGAGNSFEWAATRLQQWKPNTVLRYRNTDSVLRTDPYGNNLTQGAEYLPAHDWRTAAASCG